jgi:CRP-like cAMP-binding protein
VIVTSFLRALEKRDDLSDREVEIVQGLFGRPRFVSAKRDIISEGDSPSDSCLILEGLAGRYSIVRDGRRQISAVHLAGDFIDLHSLLLAKMDHSVTALTDCQVCYVAHAALREVTENEPHLARLFWMLTIIDAATHRRWLLTAGRLAAGAQLAHFLCEMYVRATVVELAEGLTFRLPISQIEISDVLGLSVVHVNRIVQDLRARRLIRWQSDVVEILDWPALAALAEFDPTYLNLEKQRR